jgi:ornithine cyclodeaminase
MRIITLGELQPLLDKKAVVDVVRTALIAHADGQVQSPMPGELTFHEPHGDCHIKYGHRRGADSFAIKVSTGFYNNEALGLPVNNGLTIVFDARTGLPKILFQDEGWLTAWRTVAATFLAVQIAHPRLDVPIGIIGTGLQGHLAGEWLREFLPNAEIVIYGRNWERTKRVADDLELAHTSSLEALMEQSDVIITATPSTKPLFDSNLVRPGMHFVGVGADSIDKHELPTGLFALADHIIVDDRAQCLGLGDFGRAVQANAAREASAQALGDILNKGGLSREKYEISVVDLTGIAAQDIAIAELFARWIGRDQ